MASPSFLRLAFAGDVMLGRGVDAVNVTHRCSPEIYESCCRSAFDYVRLSRAAHGDPPAGHPAGRYDDPRRAWGTLLPDLRGGDDDRALCVNLETALTSRGAPWPDKGINYRAHPVSATDALLAAGVDFCALANNHVLDWGEEGLADTLDALDAAGVRRAGAGRDEDEAWRPAPVRPRPPRKERGARGGDSQHRREGRSDSSRGSDDAPAALVLSVAHESSGVPRRWAATKTRPGVALVAYDDRSIERARDAFDRAEEALLEASSKRRRRFESGDSTGPPPPPPRRPVRVVSVHWGGNWGWAPEPGQEAFARGLVRDASAAIVWGHSSHHAKAVAFDERSPILFGCGDLLNDYEGIAGFGADRGFSSEDAFPRGRRQRGSGSGSGRRAFRGDLSLLFEGTWSWPEAFEEEASEESDASGDASAEGRLHVPSRASAHEKTVSRAVRPRFESLSATPTATRWLAANRAGASDAATLAETLNVEGERIEGGARAKLEMSTRGEDRGGGSYRIAIEPSASASA